MDEEKAPSPKRDERKDASEPPSGDSGATNPFEETDPGSTNPFGSDHDMDAQPGGEAKSESTEMDTNTEPNSAEASVVSADLKDAAPQLTPEEQARLEQARKISQKDILNGGNTPAALTRKRKTPEELAKLPTRSYLDETVVPVLLVGMSELARRRPDRPLEWLAKYLMSKQEIEDGIGTEENGIEKGGDADEMNRSNPKGKIPSQVRLDSASEPPVSEISST